MSRCSSAWGVLKAGSSVGFPRGHVRLCSEAAAPGGVWAAEPALWAGSRRGPALGAGSWPSVPCSPARPEPDGGRVPRHGATGGTEFAGHRAGTAGRAVPGAQVGAAEDPGSKILRLGWPSCLGRGGRGGGGRTGARAHVAQGTRPREELWIITGVPFSWPSPPPSRPSHFVKSFSQPGLVTRFFCLGGQERALQISLGPNPVL